MSLMVEIESIEEVARRTHQRHFSRQIGGQERPFAVDGVGKTVTVADAWGHRNIV